MPVKDRRFYVCTKGDHIMTVPIKNTQPTKCGAYVKGKPCNGTLKEVK